MQTQRAAVTKIAAIYDIHGNLPALEAVLADISTAEPNLILVGGDVASGPMPRETVALLMSLGERAIFIRGNGDREVVTYHDRPGYATEELDEAARESEFVRVTAWTAAQLPREQRDFLESFVEHATFEIEGLGSTLFCHGSPRSDEEIITRASPDARVREMLAGVAQDVIVCGHTHMQFDRVVAGKRVVNAGSVGMPYEGRPGAYWALLGPDVSLRRTTYNFERAADQVRAGGMPGAEGFARENVLASPAADEATALFERMAEERAR